MDCGKIQFLVVLVVLVALFCVLAAQNSEGNRKVAERFSDNGDSWDAINIGEDTAEKIWSYCSKELKDSTEAFKELNSDLSQWTLSSYIDFDSSLMVVKNAIADLPSNKKEALLDCLREKTLASQILQVEEETWLNKYQNHFSSWATVPRRYLRRKIRHRLELRTAPASAPALAPDLIPSLAPAPTFFTAKFQVHALSPAPESFPLQDVVNPPSPSYENYPSVLPPQTISPFPPKSSEMKKKKYFVAALVAGAVTGVFIAALFLLCFTKRNKIKIEPKDGQRDDKSFLNLCAIDISPVSLQKTNGAGIGNSNNDYMDPSTIAVIDASSKAESHKLEAGEELTDKSSSSLSLPPGRTAPSQPPAPPPKPPASAPPPPPKVSRPPPNPPRPHHRGRSSTGEAIEVSEQSEAPKTKLKPFFWDKVLASSNRSMVWHEIKSGSFQFNEEMMENLFGYATSDKRKGKHSKDSEAPKFIQIIDPKKSQNLAILLKALNVTTEEVCDALNEGNELSTELIETLLKMAPTSEEELKLRLYSGDVSNLGPAERFLKVMLEIPFAFKRFESLLFMSMYQEEVSSIKESYWTLEVACKELKNNRLFLKLLEAVLKTGNRMNNGTFRGGAHAFKLDTLLKLSDVKGTDGKTTLLHFVVQEITRSEGLRAAHRLKESQSMSSVKTENLLDDSSSETEKYHRNLGLQVVSGLSDELKNVKKAALIDNEVLTVSLSKLEHTLVSTKEFLEKDMKNVEGDSDFRDTLAGFVEHVESDVAMLLEKEKRIMALVKSTGDYFHGRAGKDEGSRLFVIIRDFLLMLDKACKDVKNLTKFPSKAPEKETLTPSPSQESLGDSLPDYRQRLFPAIRECHVDHGVSSDEES